MDITPSIGIPIGGNCRDDFFSRGVHDNLYADILIIANNVEKIILIDLDWCETSLEILRGIKQRISKDTGINYLNICITMTHTHSGPDTLGFLDPKGRGLLPVVQAYLSDVAIKIVQGIKMALIDMQDIMIGTGKGYEDRLSYNRRVFFKDGSLHMNWEMLENTDIQMSDVDEPEGPIDPDIYVIKICDLDEKIKAVVVNYTLHPAVLVGKDWLFSKDYIWGLEDHIKQTLGKDVFVYFANGAEGNINHINMLDRSQEQGWIEAYRIGSILGNDVIRIMENIQVKETTILNIKYESIWVPVREITREEIENAEKLWQECKGVIPGQADGLPQEWYAGNILKIVRENIKFRELELHVIRIGNDIIATLPGEFFTEFGLQIKNRSPFANTLIFGLANQSIGYVPTKDSFKNGGYETATCETSILIPEAGNMIVDNLLRMIEETSSAGHQ